MRILWQKERGQIGMVTHILKKVHPKKKLTPWNIQDFLKSPESLADYLEAALEENDHVFLTIAVNDVVKAIRKNKKNNK